MFRNYNPGLFTVETYYKDPYTKHDEAFSAGCGVCYTDRYGNDYTYGDLYALTRSREGTEKLYEFLSGDTPAEELEGSAFFRRCERCGTWRYTGFSLKGSLDSLCPFCTPLRTGGEISLWKDPYGDDRRFFSRRRTVFEPGITTLVGCNGAGKTTLLANIREELKKRGTPCISFDNLGEEGGENGARNFFSAVLGGYADASGDDMTGLLSETFLSSEGEKIVSALGRFASGIRKVVGDCSGYGELWLLFDALDSGLSADMIEDVKRCVLDPVSALNTQDYAVYIILSSNSYEMSEGTKCFSVEKLKYIPVGNYAAFKKAVLSSRVYKEKRDEVFRIKSRIAERPYEFKVDRSLWDASEKRNGAASGEVLEMVLDPFRLAVYRKLYRYDYEDLPRLYKKEGGEWKRIRCDMDRSATRDSDVLEEVKEEIHRYLCRKVFLYERAHKGASSP